MGLPMNLFRIPAWLYACPGVANCMGVDFTEWFSGVGELARAFKERKCTACGFDVTNHAEFEDIMGCN
eukprot:600271-Alexandrium_andersonii.AAC.1